MIRRRIEWHISYECSTIRCDHTDFVRTFEYVREIKILQDTRLNEAFTCDDSAFSKVVSLS